MHLKEGFFHFDHVSVNRRSVFTVALWASCFQIILTETPFSEGEGVGAVVFWEGVEEDF